MKVLFAQLAATFPHDVMMARMRKKLYLASDFSPIYMLEEVGQALYGYREQIYAADEDFFLVQGFQDELDYLELPSDYKRWAVDLIGKVKHAYQASDPHTRETLIDSAQALLDIYLEYLMLKAQ